MNNISNQVDLLFINALGEILNLPVKIYWVTKIERKLRITYPPDQPHLA